MRKIEEGAFCARRPSPVGLLGGVVWRGRVKMGRWGGEGALALQYVPRVLIEYTEGRFEN